MLTPTQKYHKEIKNLRRSHADLLESAQGAVAAFDNLSQALDALRAAIERAKAVAEAERAIAGTGDGP